MKLKKLFLGLVVFTVISMQSISFADVPDSAIKNIVSQYKSGNYLGCIQKTDEIIKQDPSNIYAHYYRGLSYYQLGKHDNANESFTKVETLNSNATLVEYASRAKACMQNPAACSRYSDKNKTELDRFINSTKFLDNPVQSEVNKKKLERIKENINNDINNNSGDNKKSEMPTNEEIANAVKTLAKLGINPMANMGQAVYQNPEMMQMSMLLGNNTQNSNGMNMLPFFMMNQGNAQNMSPELIQTMMMNQLTPTY